MNEGESKVHHCCVCNEVAPQTETNYTLISSRFGWRLMRRVDDDGSTVAEWYCPKCWRARKENPAAKPAQRTSKG